jgi:hypothetical protein
MYVHFVVKDLHKVVIVKNMNVFIQVKNHLCVLFLDVVEDFQEIHI